MQPMLVIGSEVPGLIYINGRMVGEASPGEVVSLPVSARGGIYVEHRPLHSGYIPMARRVTLSGGLPVPSSLEGQDGMQLIAWPGGVLEMELRPEVLRSEQPLARSMQFGDINLSYHSGNGTVLELSRDEMLARHALPDEAMPPTVRVHGGLTYLIGAARSEQYALVLGHDLSTELLSVSGRSIEILEDGQVRALIELNDSVGHARLITWRMDGNAFVPSAIEPMWAMNGPKWPDSPRDTALAAAEAMQAGLMDEAEAYFVPNEIVAAHAVAQTIQGADGVTALKYPLLDGQQAIGLLRVQCSGYAKVEPVYYHALPMGGNQGTWRLDRLSIVAPL